MPQLRVRVGSGSRRVVSWRVYYWSRSQGRPRTRTIGRWPGITLAQARAQARQILAQAQLRQDEPPVRPEPRRAGISLRALSEAVLATLRRRLRPATLASYEGSLRRYVLPTLGDRPAARVSRAEVALLVRRLAEDHPTSAHRTLEAVRRVYSAGIDLGLIEASPVAGLRAPVPLSPRERVYSVAELRAILRALRIVEAGPPGPPGASWAALEPGRAWASGQGDRLLPEAVRAHCRAARLVLLTGCRRAEVYAARVEEIDLEAGVWRLPGSRTKSRRPHVVQLSGPAVALLRAMLEDARDGWLLPSPRPDIASATHLRPQHGAMLLLRRVSATPDLRLHDLRRTVATGLAEAGCPALVMAAALGHRLPLPAATAVYLRHDYAQEVRAALEAWAARLAEIAS